MIRSTRVLSRRTFLRDLGHGAFGLTVVALAACAPKHEGTFDPLTYAGNLEEIEAVWCEEGLPSAAPPTASDPDPAVPRTWERIGDAQASGYILVRDGEATVVDTGPWCMPELIEGGLMAVGLDWSAVSSVIVTHKHPDHWVGLRFALELAVDAVAYAGAADIPHIASPRPVVAVGAGDRVMDLVIIPTPGHTPGHIVVHDEAAGVLVVGDAISYDRNQGFILLGTSEDLRQAQASVGILGGLSFDTLLPGHGDTIVGGAHEQLTEFLLAT